MGRQRLGGDGKPDRHRGDGSQPSRACDEWSQFSGKEIEWCSREREPVLLQVVHYRTYTMRQVLEARLRPGVGIRQDQSTASRCCGHGARCWERCPVAVIRESWFVGPHHLVDRPACSPQHVPAGAGSGVSQRPHRRTLWAGIARAMPAQDEVNLRRIKLTFLLQAKRVIMDKDATNMSRDQVLEQVERPDGIYRAQP